MNIVVQTYDGRVQCRPDTSWEREDRDLFAPDFISAYDFVPVLFARICKAGKCIGGKFAGRYYDAVNYGILLDAITVSGEPQPPPRLRQRPPGDLVHMRRIDIHGGIRHLQRIGICIAQDRGYRGGMSFRRPAPHLKGRKRHCRHLGDILRQYVIRLQYSNVEGRIRKHLH